MWGEVQSQREAETTNRHGSYKESRYSLRTTAKQSKFKRESGYTLEGLQRLAYMSSQDFSRISVEADDHSGE